jgi:hypothetical protein
MKTFTGISNAGQLREAISVAVLNAKSDLRSDYVEWKLVEVTGKYGGFAQVENLTVKIEVTGLLPS